MADCYIPLESWLISLLYKTLVIVPCRFENAFDFSYVDFVARRVYFADRPLHLLTVDKILDRLGIKIPFLPSIILSSELYLKTKFCNLDERMTIIL